MVGQCQRKASLRRACGDSGKMCSSGWRAARGVSREYQQEWRGARGEACERTEVTRAIKPGPTTTSARSRKDLALSRCPTIFFPRAMCADPDRYQRLRLPPGIQFGGQNNHEKVLGSISLHV